MNAVVTTRNNTILFPKLIMMVCNLSPLPSLSLSFSYQKWSFAGLILFVLSLNARQFPMASGMEVHLHYTSLLRWSGRVSGGCQWGVGGGEGRAVPGACLLRREKRFSGDQGQSPLVISFKDQDSPCCRGNPLFKLQILVN